MECLEPVVYQEQVVYLELEVTQVSILVLDLEVLFQEVRQQKTYFSLNLNKTICHRQLGRRKHTDRLLSFSGYGSSAKARKYGKLHSEWQYHCLFCPVVHCQHE